jgi:UDP-N-acetylglucosamine diphosphorylase/glucosamine-1-phosphate N-acetyltransferase
MTPVFVFDDGKGLLSPLADLRCSFDVRSGALTMLERLRKLLGTGRAGEYEADVAGLLVPQDREPLARETHDLPVNRPAGGGDPVVIVNGRCVDAQEIAELDAGEARIEPETGDLIAAHVRPAAVPAVLKGDFKGLKVVSAEGRSLLSRPWHVRTFRDEAIRFDLGLLTEVANHRPPAHTTVLGAGEISVSPTAKVWPLVILDASQGEIVVDEHAVLRPGAVLIGPCYVGPHSTVLERATIRANTAIGPWCKVNGEVSGVIFQGYANKAHDGFLGDSWVGEWVNLGAGTTNSNLLNTYGEVVSRAAPGGANERTGEQFMGAIIGDHVKTAICTRIMTGAVMHTGTMWAAGAAYTGTLPAFTWGTDESRRQYRLSKFMEVAKAAMERRSVTPSAAYEARLAELHAAAASQFVGT